MSVGKAIPSKAFDDILRDQSMHNVEIIPNLISYRPYRVGRPKDGPMAAKAYNTIQCEHRRGLGYVVDCNEAIAPGRTSYSVPIVTSRIQATNNCADLGVVRSGVQGNTADNDNTSQPISAFYCVCLGDLPKNRSPVIQLRQLVAN